ncbi:MAG: pentapeptide repeat-containing protein [Myxococcales bacterium]|nr:pentapeptide repeat-containing protein [Myxococcales bacterium]
MELVRDTPFEHGVLFWPVQPPLASMLVVVKATYVIQRDGLALATPQPPTSGERYWDDDPERSVRTPSDFAILKPRGECFVVGHCRPLTGRPETQTAAAFRIGAVEKSFAVLGDRTWDRDRPGRPIPFTEMPLSWERAFGGPGNDANPVGTSLPNIEAEGQRITDKGSRPAPTGSFPIGMTWPARAALTGTYDERWRATRFPWLPDDFRFAYFNEAPLDQQIEGFWRGDETIMVKNLHPSLPRAEVRLPRLLPRVFVEHDDGSPTPGVFEEVSLVLDTITVDADEGTVACVWRGRRTMATEELGPVGLGRIFTMHEDLSAEGARAASLEACRARMDVKLAAQAAALEAMKGVAPPAPEDDGATVADAQAAQLAAARAAAQSLADAKAKTQTLDVQAKIADLKQQLAAAGIDTDAAMAANDEHLPSEPMEPPTREELIAKLEAGGMQPRERDIDGLMATLEAMQAPPEPPPAPPPAPDLRAIVIEHHRAGRPIAGDFSGVNLASLDLRGLDARDAILMDANFRGASLVGAKLDGATLIRADFFRTNLTRASLRGADLSDAVLEEAQLGGAKLERADLSRAELQGAVLDDADLGNADLTDASLEGASLAGARCRAAVFNGAKLAGARFVGASLVETRLYGVSAPGLELDRADLTKLRVGRGADLRGAKIRDAKAVDSHWRDATLVGAAFGGTNLTRADFTRADLERAHLAACRLRGAVFQEGKLIEAMLAGADVYEGSFAGADLSRADLSRANLYRASFFKARGEGVRTEGANVDGTYWEAKR